MICGITGGTPNLGTHIVKRELDEKIQWLIGHLENVLDYSMLDEEINALNVLLHGEYLSPKNTFEKHLDFRKRCPNIIG